MTADYCEMSDLPRDQCGHCRTGSRTLADAESDTMFQANTAQFGPWIEAAWPGRCAADRRHLIEPGDQIRPGDRGWLCADCGQEEA